MGWQREVEHEILELLTLKKGWDLYGGKAVDPANIAPALKFIDAVAAGIPRPKITPSSGGGIMIEWTYSERDFEVFIENGKLSYLDQGH